MTKTLKVGRRTIITVVIGSLAYAALNLAPDPLSVPGLHTIGVRPSIAIPVLMGLVFGPVAGFLIGLLGSVTADVFNFGEPFWNWDVGHGLIGVIAGLVTARMRRRSLDWRGISIGTIVGALAIVVGVGFAALTDILVANLTPDVAISREWLAAARWDLAWGVPLTLITLVGFRAIGPGKAPAANGSRR